MNHQDIGFHFVLFCCLISWGKKCSSKQDKEVTEAKDESGKSGEGNANSLDELWGEEKKKPNPADSFQFQVRNNRIRMSNC